MSPIPGCFCCIPNPAVNGLNTPCSFKISSISWLLGFANCKSGNNFSLSSSLCFNLRSSAVTLCGIIILLPRSAIAKSSPFANSFSSSASLSICNLGPRARLKRESAKAVLSGTPVCNVLFNAIPPSIASSLAIANGPKAPFMNLPAVAALLVNLVSVALAASSPCLAFCVKLSTAFWYACALLQPVPLDNLQGISGNSLFIKAARPFVFVFGICIFCPFGKICFIISLPSFVFWNFNKFSLASCCSLKFWVSSAAKSALVFLAILAVPKSNFLVDPFPMLTPIVSAKFSMVLISFLSLLGFNKAFL